MSGVLSLAPPDPAPKLPGRMTRLLAGFTGLWLGLALAVADNQPEVTLELLSEQTQFLPSEKLPVSVRISNHSGRKLKFGRDNQWLSFTVEEIKGGVINRRSEPSVDGEFDLETGGDLVTDR